MGLDGGLRSGSPVGAVDFAAMRMTVSIVFGLLVVLLGVPFVLSGARRLADEPPPSGAPRIIVVTPHVAQIRSEFAEAFDRWHEANYGERAIVDFRTPGGTSEIRGQLEARVRAAVKQLAEEGRLDDADPSEPLVFEPGTIEVDLMFGGGSYDHGSLKGGVQVPVTVRGEAVTFTVPISTPVDLSQDELDDVFGENAVGSEKLYDPDRYWIGTALSSFGIVYNRDVYAKLGIDEPTTFDDLTDHRLHGWVALADPRQSGSITTTFDSILGNYGWDEGWRILRAMCGNTRYFTNSSTKPPLDVSQGEAAAGLAIDFYGRTQAQSVGGNRVGFVDPAGAVYVDADPVSMINGAPHPEIAQRFVRFCLSEEGQALWQFPPVGDGAPADVEGPRHYALRRMPIRRSMYRPEVFAQFVDKVDPFSLASKVANPGWRTGVQMMMGCYGIDIAEDCRAAWGAIGKAREDESFPPEVLAEMERRYYAWPTTPINLLANHPAFDALSEPARAAIKDAGVKTVTGLQAAVEGGLVGEAFASLDEAGREQIRELARFPEAQLVLPWTERTYRAVRNEWRGVEKETEIRYTRFFREQYASIERMWRSRSLPAESAGSPAASTSTPAEAGPV